MIFLNELETVLSLYTTVSLLPNLDLINFKNIDPPVLIYKR